MGPVKITLTQIHTECLENAIYFHQKNPIGLTWGLLLIGIKTDIVHHLHVYIHG